MICPECGNFVAPRRNICEMCGYDLSLYKKAIRLSNSYYNSGLEKAQVRDLTGAVVMLKKSLEMNKRNTDARNLLGLVYFEMGETVAAISEWVISKHFQPEENDADTYMTRIQENPVLLDQLNQSIKKYNTALAAVKQGSDDLARIQLKKVISINPKYIKALQLLSLLYIKNGDYERAQRYLIQAGRIDVSNTLTLKYLAHIEKMRTGEVTEGEQEQGEEATVDFALTRIAKHTEYKEDKPNIWAFINLLVGIALGAAVIFFLVVPARETRIRDEYKAEVVDYSSTLNGYISSIDTLNSEKEGLESRILELERKLDAEQGQVEYINVENPIYEEYFDSLYDLITIYVDFLEKESPDEEAYIEVAEKLMSFNVNVVDNERAQEMYERISKNVLVTASVDAYTLGRTCYDEGKYEKALEYLYKAHSFDAVYDRPIYYIARSYQELGNYEKAVEYFGLLIETCPDSSLLKYAEERYNYLKAIIR